VKTQNNFYYTPFKVIEVGKVGINRKSVSDFLLVK